MSPFKQETKKDEDNSDEPVIVTKEDLAKTITLKQSAITNLNKYLEMVPDTKDKETIEEMIKQSEEFISGDKKEESQE